MPDRPPDGFCFVRQVGGFCFLRPASSAARSHFDGSVGTQPLRMGHRRLTRREDHGLPTRQRGPVFKFFEKSAGCLGFDQGIAALISRLDVFPQGVTCCHYTRRVSEWVWFLGSCY